jgi:hypothetical protein
MVFFGFTHTYCCRGLYTLMGYIVGCMMCVSCNVGCMIFARILCIALQSVLCFNLVCLSVTCLPRILNNISQTLAGYVWNRGSCIFATIVIDHVLDCLQFQRHCLVNFKGITIVTLESTDHLNR